MQVRSCFLVQFALALLLAVSTAAHGQANDLPAQNAEPTPSSPPAQTSAPVPAAPPGTLVFVPYTNATGPRLGIDQSVLLPYAEFLKLRGTSQGQPDSPEFSPLASISQSSFKGTLLESVAKFDVEFALETIAKPDDLLEIQLPFAEASIETVSVAEGEATLAPIVDRTGLRVIMRGGGRRVVRLRIATPVGTQGAERTLSFHFPRAAASSLQLEVPQDVRISANPESVPATVVSGQAGGARIDVSCGSLDHVTFNFSLKQEMTGSAAQTRLEVRQDATIHVSSGAAGVRSAISVIVLAGRASVLRIQIPAGLKLLSISGPFVKDWSFQDIDRVATVALIREVGEPFELQIDAEYEAPAETSDHLTFADFHILDSVRETGTITIAPDEGLSLWPEEVTGLEGISVSSAEGTLRGYRFAQSGWKLVLSRRRVPARVRSDGIILYEVTDDFVRLKTRHSLTVTGGGIFGVTFEVPEGYELREAGPLEVVAGFRAQGRSVQVNFRGEQRSTLDVDLRLERKRSESEPELSLEPVKVLDTEEDAGYSVIAAPLALRVTEKESSTLSPMDVRTLQSRLGPLLSADLIPMLGYRYFTAVFGARAAIEKQRTRLTCQTDVLASITPSLLTMTASLNYNVEFSATDTFQLLVPVSAGDEVRFDGADIREKDRAEAPADAELTTWTIRLQSPVIGPYTLSVSFDQPVSVADSSKPVELTVPGVRAAGIARETGNIAVSRGENLEVTVLESGGLEPRDAKELPASLAGAFLGFRYFDPERVVLKLQLVRHELESMLGALVRRMHIETVLSDQREATHEVILEVQNNREQYLELGLPTGMKIWSAFVRGVPVRPTIREKDKANLIELTKSESKDTAFRVRLILRETLDGGALGQWGKLHFLPPQPLNIPVLRSTWKLYLPARWRYVKFAGGMRLNEGYGLPWIEPAAELLLNDLPAEIAGGIAQPSLQPAQAIVGTQYDGAETDEEKRGRLQSAALEIPLVREGVQFEFSSLAGIADIEVRYWKTKALVILQGTLALLVFFGLLARMVMIRRLRPAMIALGGAFILASLTDGMTGRLCATVMASSAASLALGAAVTLGRRMRQDSTTPRPVPWSADVPVAGDWREQEMQGGVRPEQVPAEATPASPEGKMGPAGPSEAPEARVPEEVAEQRGDVVPEANAPIPEGDPKPVRRKKKNDGGGQ